MKRGYLHELGVSTFGSSIEFVGKSWDVGKRIRGEEKDSSKQKKRKSAGEVLGPRKEQRRGSPADQEKVGPGKASRSLIKKDIVVSVFENKARKIDFCPLARGGWSLAARFRR